MEEIDCDKRKNNNWQRKFCRNETLKMPFSIHSIIKVLNCILSPGKKLRTSALTSFRTDYDWKKIHPERKITVKENFKTVRIYSVSFASPWSFSKWNFKNTILNSISQFGYKTVFCSQTWQILRGRTTKILISLSPL